MSFLTEFIHIPSDTLIFYLAIGISVSLFASQFALQDTIADKASEKTNVYEISGEYTQEEYLVSSASILYDIIQNDNSLRIQIDSYIVKEEDWKQINLGDYSSIINVIEKNHDYYKQYQFGNNGEITGVIYRPHY